MFFQSFRKLKQRKKKYVIKIVIHYLIILFQRGDKSDIEFSASTPTPAASSSSTTSIAVGTNSSERKIRNTSRDDKMTEVMTKISEQLQSLQEDVLDRFEKHVVDRLRAVSNDQVKFAMTLISESCLWQIWDHLIEIAELLLVRIFLFRLSALHQKLHNSSTILKWQDNVHDLSLIVAYICKPRSRWINSSIHYCKYGSSKTLHGNSQYHPTTQLLLRNMRPQILHAHMLQSTLQIFIPTITPDMS